MSAKLAAPGVSPDAALVGALDHVIPSETDRSRLQNFIHAGHASARARIRAQVPFKLGEGWSLAEVCRAFDVYRNTILNVRARFAEDAG